MAGLAARLLALHELHTQGILTDDEFARAKQRLIAEHQEPPPPPPPPGQAAAPPALNPVVPAVGLALGAAAVANGGLGG